MIKYQLVDLHPNYHFEMPEMEIEKQKKEVRDRLAIKRAVDCSHELYDYKAVLKEMGLG